jgi:hypothetical protein
MRVFNRLLGLMLGLAIAAGGLLVIIEAVSTGIGSGFVWVSGHDWVRAFETTPWAADEVIAISIAVAAVGFLLFVAEFRPQRKRVARYSTDHGTWLLLRRSTEAHLQRRLTVAVPTSPIKVRLKPRALLWRLNVRARAATSTAPVLQAAALSELERLHSPKATRVRVKTTGANKKASS